MGETPFGLVYGSEDVTPTKIVVSSHRINYFHGTLNDVKRRVELDLM